MEDIIGQINSLLEDKPYIIVTRELIREYIESNMDLLIDEIEKEVN